MSLADEFIKTPSYDILLRCTKENLLKIAENYSIEISAEDKKLKDLLFKAVETALIDKNIVVAGSEGPVSPVSGASNISDAELKLREFTFKERQMQYEAAKLRTERDNRSVKEKEIEKELQIRKLEIELEMRKLEFEERERNHNREYERQREKDQQDFALKKLQLELAARKEPVPDAAEAVTIPLPPCSPPRSASTHDVSPVVPSLQSDTGAAALAFDVSRNIRLVPPFNEREVEKYFSHFEKVAITLKWPVNVWSLLLQCVLSGKAQEVYSALSVEQSSDYETVKKAILNAFELVPEAYRQKFRRLRKSDKITYVEFAREKETLFDRWCTSEQAQTRQQLRELILLEEFKNGIPEAVATHLNERQVTTLAHAAVCADQYTLTHKSVFTSIQSPSPRRFRSPPTSPKRSWRNSTLEKRTPSSKSVSQSDSRECFYCHEVGHLIALCPSLKKKNQPVQKQQTTNKTTTGLVLTQMSGDKIDSGYEPFILDGVVSLSGNGKEVVPVKILRDTGAAQSFIIDSVLPFSEESYCGSDVLVQGIEMGSLRVPLHMVHLKSELVSGIFKVAVCSQLPVNGVTFLLGNDVAGGKILPYPEVITKPVSTVLDSSLESVFTACVVTRAQSRKYKDAVDLSDTFMSVEKLSALPPSLTSPTPAPELSTPKLLSTLSGAEKPNALSLSVDKALISREQREDPSLSQCRAAAENGDVANKSVSFYWEDDLLLRKWTPPHSRDLGWNTVFQLVVPVKFRLQVLTLGHDHDLAGHLGVKKTYDRILRYFFWPGLKADVVKHCKSCHRCQLAGKPNQRIPPAPLRPIPAIGEPFERIILDCVGPLPKTKSGHCYILTIMCAATRYPEAVPLRSLKTKPIVRALVRFFSTFGLPKEVQTDQGSNFLSRLFKEVLSQLSIKHVTSSAYHPQSQGALERFHQTLKSMFRTYCGESKEWDEGLPLLLFAVRETTQESLGFSPADLIFGHTIRGPLRLLREEWGSSSKDYPRNILDYVSSFRERLHRACECARETLSDAQSKMKGHYDQKAVSREFAPGDKVLVLLPVVGSVLQARFSGPYDVHSKLSETDYVVCTPDRRRKTRVCHINMLKAYVSRNGENNQCDPVSVAPVCAVTSPYCPEEDGLTLRDVPVTCARLPNSEILRDLDTFLSDLSNSRANDIKDLICMYSSLFSDVPTCSNVLFHDIDVGEHAPIKQHAYRLNPVKRSAMKAEVAYLAQHGLAVPSRSAWSSPCILVPKPDGTYRFCTDYRKVNAVTKPDSFPLPRMEDCVDRVGSASFVSKLDLLKGYWQVALTPRAAEISAFVTPDSFMQYSVMAFGLRNAPASFQRLMNTVLAGVQNCEAYLDDVVIYSNSWCEHIESIRTVFERLRDAALTLNLAKCEFGKATVTYLGKEVGQGQVRPLEAKVVAISQFPVPTTKRELRRFLGMIGYYRSFCRNFSDVVLPLTNLLGKTSAFVWSADCQAAFDNAKALLCGAPVLAAPNFQLPFKLEVDASATGAGAVLLQEDGDGLDHPICYFSKKFLRHQLNYSTIEKEALALLLSLQQFEVYIGSSSIPVVVFTDHNPLIFLSRMKNTNQRIMRWSLYLQGFNLEIRYKKGTDNVLADTLSRSHQ